MYNLETVTFFTPCDELGLALHELSEISGLSVGEIPDEQHISQGEELYFLKAKNTLIYEMNLELLCHFNVCGQITDFGTAEPDRRFWLNTSFVATDALIEDKVSLTSCTVR